MSRALAWRIAAREMRHEFGNGLRGFRVFLACLILGVASIAAIGTLREGIRSGLADQGSVILGGDAEVRFDYRSASAQERAWIDAAAERVAEVTEFRSMAIVGEERVLTQVKAVDDQYPLYGEPVLEPAIDLAQALAPVGDVAGAVMDPVLADRMGLSIGDRFALGASEFQLTARLIREPDSSGAGIGLGPRTLVRKVDLASSGLLAQGAMFETNYRLALPLGTDLDAAEARFDAQFEGSDIRWRDSRRAAGGVERFVSRISSFLVLVGLAGLAVGGVGIAQAVRAWAERKTETIATLKAVGASTSLIRTVFMSQVVVMGLIGIALGVLVGAGLPVILSGAIAKALPFPTEIGFAARAAGEAALYGALVTGIFALWPLERMILVRPAALYRAAAPLEGRPGRGAMLTIVALVTALLLVAIGLSSQPMLAGLTLLGVVVALGLLGLIALGIRHLSARLARRVRGKPMLRAALVAMGAARGETMATVLSLGLGLSVLSSVGQVDAGLRGAIATDLPKLAPAYFMLDIQPDQVEPFTAQVEATPAVTRMDTAPMLRGVITQINGRPAREFGDHWVLRGDRGITYSAEVPETTPVVAGEWWPADYDGPPLVSFAAEEAEEIGLTLGDEITVNILGRSFTAEIASLREVDFSTAGMGFVMVFDPQTLKAAPHTSIATLYTDAEDEAIVLRALAKNFPNVTAIRVRDAIARVSEALAAIARATALAAGVTLLTGFAVLIGAAAAGERARAREAALLKVLGASRAKILGSFLLRSALMGLAAALVALVVGVTSSWAVMVLVMEASYSFAPLPALWILVGGVGVTLLAGMVFALRPLSARPAGLLKAGD
ncbi:ABC transporter permease [Albirhodobacter sp. R86504]|uniref:ABC transporter permease n=1 Tax=Albirhodobacter sp. R86504 TaxID=3093848 RepID=UPI00366CD98B